MSYPIGGINHAYLGTSVYTSLREALVTGKLKPDDKLRIRDLATQLGTSVTPVRDAILQLAKEQALVMKTPKDIRVPILTVQQYLEIHSVRLALEGLAAQTAASMVTDEDLERIESNINANLDAIHRADMGEALSLNQSFHFFFADIAQMPLMRGFLDSLWMRTGPLLALAYNRFSEKIAIEHHWEVLAALKIRDGAAARQAICEDIIDGHDMLLEYIKSR
ncbi:GntR family transcriptional regulator [Pseudomonas lutea]|jgi:DNA-binding GntR family transcriptional regulator|uniref:GntR family transcriptional regulator n=1 Tax=Pseudomonas lutea TaxID=243924 RepID=A0A9X0JHK0_9PSED|nr:GntR family transcriptional regulator [Pseudomonas lutea]KGF62880.1 GntR family transcriptional regulator [Pseudomonas lutea]